MKTNNNQNTATRVGILEWFKPGEYDRVRQVIVDMDQINVYRLRTGISWADWHVPGVDEWYDWLFEKLHAAGIDILPCFLYTPPSMGIEPKTSAPPRDLKAYADFLDVMITRYGRYFDWVELWNEPNNKVEYDFTLDFSWDQFAEMVKGAAYWAQQRGKKTLLGGMSPIDPNWLQTMFDKGVMQFIDAIGIHGFPDVFDQQWTGWEKPVSQILEVLKKNGSDAKLWITETGFSTWQNDEYKQWKEFINALDTNLERMYWYAAHDLNPAESTVGGFHSDEREYHFGLRKSNGEEKLLFRLLKNNGLAGIRKLPYIQKRYVRDEEFNEYSLITGGAGFIGTNLAKRLLEMGKKVMILDNLSREGVERNLQWLYERYPENLQIQVADIRDENIVRECIAGASEVYHYSAQVAVTTSLDKPVHDFEVNIRGALNLLEAIRLSEHKPPLLFTSTNKVYGGLPDVQFISNGSRYYPADPHIRRYGINERRPLDFHSPYGCSKGSADQYVIDYSRSYGLKTAVFRMSCIYGPHQFGTEDQGWIAHFMISLLENKPLTIYGDGKQVRDILFVDDLIGAFLLARENIESISGEAFNIGGGPENTVSVGEVISLIKKLTGKSGRIKFEEWRTGDQRYYVSDIRKFQQATGWNPRFNIEKGTDALLKWLRENRGLKAPESLKEKEMIS